jgi:feruloyl esterase
MPTRTRFAGPVMFAIVLATAGFEQTPPAAAPGSCEKLAGLTLPHTTITAAQSVAAGAFIPPPADPTAGPPVQARAFASLAAFCRVAATLKPSSDSDIKIEVWLPASGWNGKFQGVGNGGWSGAIIYPELAGGLRGGYASASTDTGHAGSDSDATFALGHPEKLTDFAYRAAHEMTVQAKAIVAAYYGNNARLSYWHGCSSGGKQGLKEAQRFPDDYDGIVAIAPANNWTHMLSAGIGIAQTMAKGPLPRDKFAVIHKAVLEACDALDGVKDGVLENPAACRFDPGTLACAAGDEPMCLTAQQVAAARAMYAETVNPKTGERIFPGFAPGSEPGWSAMAGSPEPFPIASSYFKYVVFKDPAWDFRSFDVDKDVPLADRIDGGALTATEANLKPYFGHGGKLLMFHGWNDQLISPRNTIDYYDHVVSAVGAKSAADSMRLFMVPGMMHCSGGPGPGNFDAMGALEQWVEQKRAPERITTSHLTGGTPDRTRPLCPYPQVAQYKGTGSTDEAASFICAAQK